MNQKTLVPLKELVELLYIANARLFTGVQGVEMPSRYVLLQLLETAIQDSIGSRTSRIEKHKAELPSMMRDLLPWYEEGESFSEWWYSEVWDPIDLRLMEIVSSIIPNHSWDVWTTTRRGPDIILTNHGDYRIIDWTKRVKSGEWK